tara:strand:+ start:726 stop:950 length:225 start_codon:yes stop_codon:yes gene_type:complete
MYYIGTKLKCKNYDKKVTLAESYSRVDKHWADAIEKPDGSEYAIIKHEKYIANMTLVDELGSDWFTEELNNTQI